VTIPSSGGYAPDGDILLANDSVNGNWTYGYDAFNRLVSANKTGQSYTYGYDRVGNRWTVNGSGPGFNAKNHIVGLGVTYDAAGDTTNDGTTAYTYDAEGRIMKAVNGTSGTSTYVYDANGKRVEKTTATGGTVDFLYDTAGQEIAQVNSAGAWTRGEVYAAGRHVATLNNTTTYYNHSDWLGTERARSTSAGALYETCTSLPFGDWLTCTGGDPSPMHFTSKERDSESGLDNFGARYDSSQLGRFMSPDPLGILTGQTGDPQGLNLYSYVQNNPINAVDPDGLDCVYVGGDSVSVKRGDCVSDTDNGIFVNGTIDIHSGTYDSSTGTVGFNYTNDDTGAIGKGVIGNVYPSGGVSDADRLNALGLAGQMAAPGVNLAANGLRAFGYAVAAPLMVAAECAAGAESCTKGNVAMAILPEVAALREGGIVLKEAAAAGKGAEKIRKLGGAVQAAKDFESLQGAEKVYGTTKVKTLSDGTKAVLYDSKSEGTTLAIQDAGGRTLTKYRY
jgi:RHS repeat-associated protein